MVEVIPYTFEHFQRDVNSIVKSIKKSNVKFDYIVPIVRGGLITGTVLSHKLSVPMADPASYDALSDNNPLIYHCCLKNILVVDDIIDTGNTMRKILNKHLNDTGNNKLYLCSLIWNTKQDIEPHYFGTKINRDIDKQWVKFWWEC